MATTEIDKGTLRVLQEGVKGSLGRLRDCNREQQERGGGATEALKRQFRGVRRLHDRLQQADETELELVTLELTTEESSLLASCVVDMIPEIDVGLALDQTTHDDRLWCEERLTLLVRLIENFADGTIEPILNTHPESRQTPTVRRVLAQAGPSEPQAPIEDLYTSLDDTQLETSVDAQAPASGFGDSPSHEPRVLEPGIQEPGGPLEPRPVSGIHKALPQEPRNVELLFDPNRIKEHHLRSHARLDLQDYARAQATGNLRLSLVHLGCLFEAILLDHGLGQRAELGLDEAPERWDFHDLALELFREKLDPEKEPILGVLRASRRLLRPTSALTCPIVATSTMVSDAETFLRWVLQELGYTSDDAEVDLGLSEPPKFSGVWRATKRSDDSDSD